MQIVEINKPFVILVMILQTATTEQRKLFEHFLKVNEYTYNLKNDFLEVVVNDFYNASVIEQQAKSKGFISRI